MQLVNQIHNREILFTEDGVFDPKFYGLPIGTHINYIAIGGGGAGNGITINTYELTSGINATRYNSGPPEETVGGDTKIGDYITVSGGKSSTYPFVPEYPYNDSGTSNTTEKYCLNDSIGWIPSSDLTDFMNNQLNSYNDLGRYYNENETVFYGPALTTALGGRSRTINPFGGKTLNETVSIPFTSNYVNYSKSYGFGAGGPGICLGPGTDSSWNYKISFGGDAGELRTGSFKLNSEDAFDIIIGQGAKSSIYVPDIDSNTTLETVFYDADGASGAVLLWW